MVKLFSIPCKDSTQSTIKNNEFAIPEPSSIPLNLQSKKIIVNFLYSLNHLASDKQIEQSKIQQRLVR